MKSVLKETLTGRQLFGKIKNNYITISRIIPDGDNFLLIDTEGQKYRITEEDLKYIELEFGGKMPMSQEGQKEPIWKNQVNRMRQGKPPINETMKKSQLKLFIRKIVTEAKLLENIQDPSKDEMFEYLRQMYGNEEGFRDDAEVAIYWFANFFHGGQSSNLYSALSTSRFSPGPVAKGPEPQSSEEMMYEDLVLKFAPGSEEAIEIQKKHNSLNEAVSSKNQTLIEKWMKEHGARKTAYKMVNSVVRQRTGMDIEDMADTATLSHGLDTIEASLNSGNFEQSLKDAFQAAKDFFDEEAGEGIFEEDQHSVKDLERFAKQEKNPYVLKAMGMNPKGLQIFKNRQGKEFKACNKQCANGFLTDRKNGLIYGPFKDKSTGKFLKDAEEASMEWNQCAYCNSKGLSEGDEADAVNDMWAGSYDANEPFDKQMKKHNKVLHPNQKSKQKSKKFFSGSNKPKAKTVQDFDWDAIKKNINKGTLKEWGEREQVIYKDRQGGQDVYWMDNKDTGGKIQVRPEAVQKLIKRGHRVVDLQDVNEENAGDGTQSLIDGQSNSVAAGRVNKVLGELSKGIFSDQSWEAINKIFEKLKSLGLDVTILSAKYGGYQDTSNNMPKYKEWQISIPFTNKVGKSMELVGTITAHGAGSIEQPLDRYDITAYVSAIPKRG